MRILESVFIITNTVRYVKTRCPKYSTVSHSVVRGAQHRPKEGTALNFIPETSVGKHMVNNADLERDKVPNTWNMACLNMIHVY